MIYVKSNLELLGCKVRDKVTRFEGIVTSVSFDLYGCIQTLVTPIIDTSSDKSGSSWFDSTRLDILCSTPIMSLPNYDYTDQYEPKGPASKPTFKSSLPPMIKD